MGLKPYLVFIETHSGRVDTFAVWAKDSLGAFWRLGRGVLRPEDVGVDVEELPRAGLFEAIQGASKDSIGDGIIRGFCEGRDPIIAI